MLVRTARGGGINWCEYGTEGRSSHMHKGCVEENDAWLIGRFISLFFSATFLGVYPV